MPSRTTRLDWVRECSVLGTPDPRWGEALVAVLVGDPPSDPTAAARVAEQHCREHLADYKVPRRFVFRAALPKSPTGKILRRALREELTRTNI
ncbi:AMP-binding enzyme [Actinomycetospora sp. TBRC 11914]|uniref:AMP-binding enzyme n=1 Tax=Actinomycetospora sp. TBRC 11914 TaxID=2729387 RepID=UPI0037BEE46F